MGNTEGTKASEERRNIAGIGDRECAGKAIVVQGEAKKFGGNGVSFYVVEGRQRRDEESKVFVLVVFDTKVIYHQDESDGSGGVAKKAGG